MASFEQLTDEQRANLARVAHTLLHNPEVSKDTKRLIMKADPRVKFPEIETLDHVDKSLEKGEERIKALEQQLMETEARRRLDAKHAEARARGLNPDDVEKAMTDRGIGKWETAMEFLELSSRQAPATAAGIDIGNSTRVPTPDDKDFWSDPAAAARKAAHDTIDELRGRRAARQA